jgi:hypothetical protein
LIYDPPGQLADLLRVGQIAAEVLEPSFASFAERAGHPDDVGALAGQGFRDRSADAA